MQTKYRADIDGLRAIAILLVIAYHVSSYQAPGGFIGVDIFFVISGFLISSIIFTQLDKQSFSYADFYARRIKRIFPALLLVLFTGWLLGYFVLFINEFEQLGKHIASGVAFVANIILWDEAGYFDNTAESKPFLHLWSLGVEEQFYIFYPLLVAAIWRFKAYFIWFLGALLLLSFGANIYLTHAQQVESAFYLPLPRFWELLVGSMLAYHNLYKKESCMSFHFNHNGLSILGLVLIGIGFLNIDSNASFPGWWALLPVLGAACLLSSPSSWMNQAILASKPMVFIGLISYPLYLWHWLLLSLAYITGLDSGLERLVMVSLSFVLAWLTYTLLENKVRYKKGMVVPVLAALAVLVFLLGVLTAKGKIIPRNDSESIRLAVEAIEDWSYPSGFSEVTILEHDVFIKQGSQEKVLFFGDSHIEQYAPRILKLIDEQPKRTKTAVFATRGACPPIPNLFRFNNHLCTRDYREKMIEYALSSDVSSVVIGARWEFYLDENNPYQETFSHFYLLDSSGSKKYLNQGGVVAAKAELERLLSKLSQEKDVYLVLDNPDIRNLNPKAYLAAQRFSESNYPLKRDIEYTESQAQLHAEMLAMAKRVGVKVIDPVAHFCFASICRVTTTEGSLIYKDANHLRSSYVREYVDYIDVTVRGN